MKIIETAAQYAKPVLQLPRILLIRRNHGLEHATIHMLSRRMRNLRMAGRSSARGFILLGDAPTEQIESAAQEALNRMKKGEHGLAVHPNCGTNLVTQGVLATLAAYAGLGVKRERVFFSRFGMIMLMMVLAFIAGQPLGMALQRHFTTEGNPGDLEVVSVTKREVKLPFGNARMVVHDVVTSGGKNVTSTNHANGSAPGQA